MLWKLNNRLSSEIQKKKLDGSLDFKEGKTHLGLELGSEKSSQVSAEL